MVEPKLMTWTDAAALDDLPKARPTVVRVGTTHVLLVRRGGAVHATEPLCPHKFAALEEGTVEDGCLRCPVHDAAFHLDTGEPRDGDAWAGRLQTYPVRVEAGRVHVAL